MVVRRQAGSMVEHHVPCLQIVCLHYLAKPESYCKEYVAVASALGA
jgi:hypothetical protein